MNVHPPVLFAGALVGNRILDERREASTLHLSFNISRSMRLRTWFAGFKIRIVTRGKVTRSAWVNGQHEENLRNCREMK